MKIFFKALKQSIPIITGYIPVAISFGILCKTSNINLLYSTLFSSVVFAGASQFMAIKMFALGVGSFEIILATFIMNFRHFFMSAILAENLETKSKKWYPFISFVLTDEVFAVSILGKKNIKNLELFIIQILSYLTWVLGTILGFLLGAIVSISILDSMEIALYALFIALLTPKAKKSNKVLFVILLSAFVNSLLNCGKLFSNGTDFIISVLFSAFIVTLIPTKKELDFNE